MFDLVRNHKRWMLVVVLLLILPSFVFFGIEGYARFVEGDQVLVRVGDSSISRSEYDMARRSQLDQARQMFGAGFDPIVFDSRQAREQTLQQLIDQRVMALAAAEGRFGVSDNVVRQTIAQIPAVQENGRFSPELYRQALDAQGITPAQFEASLRYDLAQALVVEPVAQSGTAPQTVVTSLLKAMQQERDVRTRRFAADDFEANIQVSDADVQQYYDSNAAEFAVPETITAEYILLNSEVVMDQVSVNDDEIAAYYEQNKGRFTTDESRRISHILIEVPSDASQDDRAQRRQQAESILATVRQNPAAFAEQAREHSQDGGSAQSGGELGWITRGTMVPEFEEVAFTLQEGQVSDLVQTEFGYHIIKADDVRKAQVKPLSDVREQLADEIRLQKAGAKFGEMAGEFTNLVYDEPTSLQPAGDALGLKVQTTAGVSREGAPLDAPELFQDGRVRQALFSVDVARQGNNSGVIELAPDRLVAVRAAEVIPAHTAPLETVADDIRQQLVLQRALQAAEEAGRAELQRLQQGGEPSGFDSPVTISRANPAGMDVAVVEAAMAVPDDAKLPTYVGAMAANAFVIAAVQSIEQTGDLPSEVVQAERAALANALAQAEVRAVIQTLRNEYEVKLEPLADTVLAEGEDS